MRKCTVHLANQIQTMAEIPVVLFGVMILLNQPPILLQLLADLMAQKTTACSMTVAL